MLASGPSRCVNCLLLACAIASLALAASCGYAGSGPPQDPPADPNVVSLNPQDWKILYGAGTPSNPSADPEGAWAFEFPTGGGSVNYVQVPFQATMALHMVTITFKVESNAAQYTVLDPGDHLPATFHIFFEQKGDNLSSADGRWWADEGGYNLGSRDGQVEVISVPLTSDQWSNVYGKQDPQAFSAALANVGWFGVTFGGQDFWGHGVGVASGSAKFIMINYVVD